MGLIYDTDANAEFRQALTEAHKVILEAQNLVEVTCPALDCEDTAMVPAPDAGMEITATRSAAFFGDYERVRCPEGHKVFVHYCEAR